VLLGVKDSAIDVPETIYKTLALSKTPILKTPIPIYNGFVIGRKEVFTNPKILSTLKDLPIHGITPIIGTNKHNTLSAINKLNHE